jgi:hypothetical protein
MVARFAPRAVERAPRRKTYAPEALFKKSVS